MLACRKRCTLDIKIVEELEAMRATGRAMGGSAAVDKLRGRGKLDARQRLEHLLDPNSFVEMGVLARSQHADLRDRTPADGLVAGYGTIDGRVVYVTSEDATVLAGTRGRVSELKTARVRELALLHKKPFIALMEAGAGRFQELNGAVAAGLGTRFREHYRLSGHVPQIAAIMGPCFGGPSFTAMQSDFVAMVRGTGFMGMSGPPVVKVGIGQVVTNEELGGADKSAKETGQVDYLAEDDLDCLRSIRDFLAYFPASSSEIPPVAPEEAAGADTSDGRAELVRLVPDNQRRAYDMRRLIALLVDGGRTFTYREPYAPNLINCWARVRGQTVGIVANQPMHLAGALDHKAIHKARKFVDICDAFHIPLVFLSDCPGFLVGPAIEGERMVSLASRFLNTVIGASVPKATIVIRKAVGLAYLALGGKVMAPDALVAWPTARFDVMGTAAGIELVWGRDIASAPDPASRRSEILAEMDAASHAYKAAEMAIIDDVIDPAETREVIAGMLARAKREPAFKHRIDP